MTVATDRPTSTTRAPISAIFMCQGILLGAWATQVPLLRDRLAIAPGALGLALFCISASALMSMPMTGWLATRLCPRPVLRAGSAIACSAFVVAVLAPAYAVLAVSLFVFGIGYGAVDVAMNAEAVRVERAIGRPILGGVHAMWSVGSFAGSAGGAALLTVMPPVAQAAVLALLSVSTISWSSARLETAHAERPGPTISVARSWRDGRLHLIGAVLCMAFAIEGAIADWSGVYLHAVRHVPLAYAASGYSAFSLCMVAMRFAGDRVRGAIGNARVLMGAFVAAVGIVMVLMAPSRIMAVAGFAVAGLGVSNVVPALFALAGARGGAAVSVVATLGYAGVLTGPPLFGAVAQATSLSTSIGLIALFCCLVGLASRRLRRA
jgi:hypothetical protein